MYDEWNIEMNLVCIDNYPEIFKRLSALNRQRWEEEEAAGLHKKGKRKVAVIV